MKDFKWSTMIVPIVLLIISSMFIPTLQTHSESIETNKRGIEVAAERLRRLDAECLRDIDMQELCTTTAVLKSEVVNLTRAIDKLEEKIGH